MGYSPAPTWLYHCTLEPRLITSDAEVARLWAEGWRDSPARFLVPEHIEESVKEEPKEEAKEEVQVPRKPGRPRKVK